MIRSKLIASALCGLAGVTPLAAQSAGMERLAFMSGCWEGPFSSRRGPGTIEERYTPPSANVMLGTTRYASAGRTTGFEFSLIRADSTGIVLVPYPDGERSPHAFRLRLAGDTAYFEAPEHDYPKRVIYRRDADGSLVARVDSGGADPAPREWRMASIACTPGLTVPAISAVAAAPPPRLGPDRSGRVLLYVTQTLNGLYLGLAIPAMFGSESPTAYGFGLLLGPSTGIMFAKGVNDARPVSLGQATAITWGGWSGWWNALGLTSLADNASSETFFRNTVIGMVGGTAVGVVLSRHPIAAGDASLVAHASVWGTWYGGVVAVLADADNGWPYLLIGGDAALLAAAAATKSVDISAGRVWITTAAGIAGLVGGLGIDVIAQTDGNTAILIPAITSFAGLSAGLAATRHYDQHARGGTPREPVLLGVREGHLRLGIPLPAPAMVPREVRGERRWAPGMRVTLFDWRH